MSPTRLVSDSLRDRADCCQRTLEIEEERRMEKDRRVGD
jgi:hypothetical protein